MGGTCLWWGGGQEDCAKGTHEQWGLSVLPRGGIRIVLKTVREKGKHRKVFPTLAGGGRTSVHKGASVQTFVTGREFGDVKVGTSEPWLNWWSECGELEFQKHDGDPF